MQKRAEYRPFYAFRSPLLAENILTSAPYLSNWWLKTYYLLHQNKVSAFHKVVVCVGKTTSLLLEKHFSAVFARRILSIFRYLSMGETNNLFSFRFLSSDCTSARNTPFYSLQDIQFVTLSSSVRVPGRATALPRPSRRNVVAHIHPERISP